MTEAKGRPSVSVVVGVFNGDGYVEKSIASALAQEGVDLEVVVVDDGSTDRTPTILAELAREDPRLTVLRQENGGLTRALIRGCAASRGEFIARHDADDTSLPGRLEAQVRRLSEDRSISMAACQARFVGPEGEPLWTTSRTAERGEATRRLVDGEEGPPCHGSVMFRKGDYERVGGYRWQFWFAQDWDLWLRLAEIGDISYLDRVLYEYRVGEANITARFRDRQLQLFELARQCRAARLRGEPEDVLLARAATVRPGPARDARWRMGGAGEYFLGRCLQVRGDPRARKYLWRALGREPWNVKAARSLVYSYLRAIGGKDSAK